jgi:Fe-Mn family superoxide dismutase
MQRRAFLKWSIGAGAMAGLGLIMLGCSQDQDGGDQPFRLPSLPYAMDALEPHLSEETLRLHYGKHHRGYVANTNRLVADTHMAKRTLIEIMRQSFRPKACRQSSLFNNAAQVYNHTIYWNSMKPEGGGEPEGLMKEWIDKAFGGYDAFREAFSDKARKQFASGWTWLVMQDGTLRVLNTGNAESPIVQGFQPLLVLDVWEHAYYVDYKNRRDQYIEVFFDHLVNWDFAARSIGEV